MTEHVVSLPIAADHPAYAGHFPGRPILPGVVLLDAALHALAARSGMPVEPQKSQLKLAKFHSPVLPGEPLTLHYAASPGGGLRFDIRCSDRQGGERSVASGSVVFAPAPQA